MQPILLHNPMGIQNSQLEEGLQKVLAGRQLRKVLLIPPDITRANSYADTITTMLYKMLEGVQVDIMPALGTHVPMTKQEIESFYAGIPVERFIAHNWRNDVVELGQIPEDFVAQISQGLMSKPITVEINKRLLDKSYDLILSIGQVVPHEVVGMANYRKNIFVGCGGSAIINDSHYLGALYGMERMMGRDNTPPHKLFDYAAENFTSHLPLVYLLTVTTTAGNDISLKAFAAGQQREVFEFAIQHSQKENLTFLDKPLQKVVVALPPHEFRTTWLGNKAIYRTRMAIADGGELLILAPGVRGFGEDPTNDRLIRKYGYYGRDAVLQAVAENQDLRENLSVAAHLIHGSSEGRFTIRYGAGGLTRQEVEKAGYCYATKQECKAYMASQMKEGYNIVNGEEIFFISNPALGLWVETNKFNNLEQQ